MKASAIFGTVICLCALTLAACSGEDGSSGVDGVDGEPGADGVDGMNGQPSADGEDGVDGMNGGPGADGEDGEDGTDGTNGQPGANGADGTNGTNGANGADGTDGTDGTNGTNGTDGASGIIDRTRLTGEFVSHDCEEQSTSGISGTIRLARFVDNTTLVTIKLDPASPSLGSGLRNAHIHDGTTNAPIVTLNKVDELTDITETIVASPTYTELLLANAYINVHGTAPAGNAASVCRGDIGSRAALTGDSELYDLVAVGGSGITGSLRLEERENGTTKATLTAVGNLGGVDRAAHFHAGTVAVPGTGVLITLTDVSSATNESVTNIATFDVGSSLTPGAPVSYDQLLALDAYVNIHPNENGGPQVATGDVGKNRFTGDDKTYNLAEAAGSAVSPCSGTARLQEREDGTTLVTLDLTANLAGMDRAAHFHPGTVAAPGTGALISLTDVNGTSNESYTEIDAFDATSPVTPSAAVSYTQLLALDGYINVHVTDAGGAAICAGDVGSNAP